MDHYTIEQRQQIVRIFYENSNSVRRTFRALRAIYGRHNRPTETTIRRIITKFESTGSVADRSNPVRRRIARSNETIAAVAESVSQNRRMSVRCLSQEFGLSKSTTWRILRKDLGLHPYKVQLTQELQPQDHETRRVFADWASEQLETSPHFGEKIIFSGEAHFWLNGCLNKENCRIWNDNNPREILETPLHSEKLTVWCGLWAGGIIGPYFFQNENGEAVTVNGAEYTSMIRNFLLPKLDGMNIGDMWFQQDDATSHTSGETRELLQEKFPGRVISQFADVEWPPRSCDLTPLDFFLWGYVKSLAYSNKPTTIEQLESNIVRIISEIQSELLQKVIENWTSRIDQCKRSRGGHLDDVIFKT